MSISYEKSRKLIKTKLNKPQEGVVRLSIALGKLGQAISRAHPPTTYFYFRAAELLSHMSNFSRSILEEPLDRVFQTIFDPVLERNWRENPAKGTNDS